MSRIIRESEVDVEQMQFILAADDMKQALEHVRAADKLMSGLDGVNKGFDPEVIRALAVVQDALEDALKRWDDEPGTATGKLCPACDKSELLVNAEGVAECPHCGHVA